MQCASEPRESNQQEKKVEAPRIQISGVAKTRHGGNTIKCILSAELFGVEEREKVAKVQIGKGQHLFLAALEEGKRILRLANQLALLEVKATLDGAQRLHAAASRF